MSLREKIAIGLVVVVFFGASLAALFGSLNGNAGLMRDNQEYIARQYMASTPSQKAVLANVSECMVIYSKSNPVLWGTSDFDATPISTMPVEKQQDAARTIRRKLEVPCLAYGIMAIQRGNAKGEIAGMDVYKYLNAAAEMGMDEASARQWYNDRLLR